MGAALAIAAMTATLKALLEGWLTENASAMNLGQFDVTTKPLDQVFPSNANESARLNLFLYQVAPNSARRNVGLPAHDLQGGRVSDPSLALDLHYLLTAYGSKDLEAEILLGYALQFLHETPALTPELINKHNKLPTSELSVQVQTVKLVLEALSTDEMSKLWAMFQSRYRLSVAFLASVVLIPR